MEHDLFGTEDTGIIRAHLNAWCTEHLGSPMAQVRFVAAQPTYATGVVVADGRQVVVQAHPASSHERLLAVFEMQQCLADAGFPCPHPLVPPARLGSGVATAEELCDAGAVPHAMEPEVRDVMAHTFAHLLSLTSTFEVPEALSEDRPAWIDYGAPDLWPTPHLPGFVLTSDDEASWIDGIASTAKHLLHQMPAGDVILGHSDYCAHNVLVSGRHVVTVYD